MSKYAIWDKKSPIITPKGEVLTAEQWIQRYPMFRVESIVPICAGGEINGAYYNTLGNMVQIFKQAGCDFSACETDQDKLDAIEAFEDAMNTPSTEPTAEERQATALEAIAMGATSESTAAMNALLTGEEI